VVPYTPGQADGGDAVSEGDTKVTFWLRFQAEYGQRLRVVGNHAALAVWDGARAPELQWTEGHMWHVTVLLPRGSVQEYKFVLLQSDGVTPAAWQQGNNAVLAIMVRKGREDRGHGKVTEAPGGLSRCAPRSSTGSAHPQDEHAIEVFDEWHDAPGLSVLAAGQRSTRSERLMAWADSMSMSVAVQRAELRRTRMELFQAEEEARSAREEHSLVANALNQSQEVRRVEGLAVAAQPSLPPQPSTDPSLLRSKTWRCWTGCRRWRTTRAHCGCS